jgi:hypothetical protein
MAEEARATEHQVSPTVLRRSVDEIRFRSSMSTWYRVDTGCAGAEYLCEKCGEGEEKVDFEEVYTSAE